MSTAVRFLTQGFSHNKASFLKTLFLFLLMFFCEDLDKSCFLFVFHHLLYIFGNEAAAPGGAAEILPWKISKEIGTK